MQGIDLLKIAGHSGILRHLCPSAFQPGSGDRGSKSVEAVLSGRREGPIYKLSMQEAASGAALLG